MELYESIKNRSSVRKYEDRAVDNSILALIKNKADNLVRLNPKINTRLEFVTQPEKVREMKIGFLGGRININAPHCIVAITEDVEGGYENVGFMQEQLVLEMVGMNIGSCWLGTFDRDVVGKSLEVKNGEVVTNVIAFGYPKKSFYNNGLRKLLGTTKRKKVEEIAFYKSWGQSLDDFLLRKKALDKIINISILAPSADNSQPVRVVVDDNIAHFFSMEKNDSNYFKIDAGIFLAHFYSACKKEGYISEICSEQVDIARVGAPKEFKYIISQKY